jgi:S-adenosylmethionine hydrolase
MLPRPSGFVTLSTDFGLVDPYVGVMKGALLRASSKVQIVDVVHDLPPQDVDAAAFVVRALVGRFPTGTVHVVVVDPGVGTARKLLAVAAHECYWLAPDNGVRSESRTFHGRDVLAPVAAWLAGGRYGFSALGPRVPDPVLLVADAADTAPRVVHVDRYGNLVSNVGAGALASARGVRIAGRQITKALTYGDVGPGELLAYVGSFGLVEIAVRGGSAAQRLEVGRGAPVELWPA